jgi:anaerobic nitric oxide reductase flavorubredoxin
VSHHVEMDHSGSLPMIVKEARKAELVTLEKFGETGLNKSFQRDWSFHAVKEGSELDLGKRKLVFIPTPMLHWPDSMASYMPEDKILFSMDAFGQHLATSSRFDDEVGLDTVMPEAAKYYANILMPFGDLIVRAVSKLGKLDIKMIAPSHGIVWRSHPETIVSAYDSWGRGESKRKAVIVYDTMWGSTGKMAHAIAEGITDRGVEAKLYRLTDSDRSDIIMEALDARALLIGSPTLNNGMFPTVAGFLCYLKGLKPRGKLAATFGSYGWAGGAVKAMQQELVQAGVELVESGLDFKFVPDKDELEKCVEFGRTMGERINASGE